MGCADGVKPVLLLYSPAPLVGSPFSCRFGHIHLEQSFKALDSMARMRSSLTHRAFLCHHLFAQIMDYAAVTAAL